MVDFMTGSIDIKAFELLKRPDLMEESYALRKTFAKPSKRETKAVSVNGKTVRSI